MYIIWESWSQSTLRAEDKMQIENVETLENVWDVSLQAMTL